MKRTFRRAANANGFHPRIFRIVAVRGQWWWVLYDVIEAALQQHLADKAEDDEAEQDEGERN